MDVREMAKELGLKALTKVEKEPRELTGGIACDLLSQVMKIGKEGQVWLTVQGHPNVAAVASLLDFAAVVVCSGTRAEEETIKKAEDNGIALFETDAHAFELAGRLYALGVGHADIPG